MEQITRDEMIGLLRANRATVKDYQNGLFDAHVTPGGYVEPGEISRELEGYQKQIEQIDSAITALQAAEPVGYGLKGLLTKQWDGKTFVEKEDADSYEEVALLPLFTLPCPPATELAPESWREELETIAEILEADGDEWNCAARIRKMLTASPAPGHSGDDNEMADALYKLANLILEKGSFRFSDWLWSDVHIPGIRAAAQYLAARSVRKVTEYQPQGGEDE